MNRLTFFKSAFGAAVTLVAVRAGVSDSRVPRRVDCREGACTLPIVVYRHGRKLPHVIAYDLDADTAVVYRTTPRGQFYLMADEIATETLHGGIVVRWDERPTT